MPRIKLANMHHYAQQVVRARPLQLHAFAAIPVLGTVGVREHVELQRELDWIVDLGRCGLIRPALLIFETLYGSALAVEESSGTSMKAIFWL